MMTKSEPDSIDTTIAISQLGHMLHIELNRPKVLNTLTLEMVRTISAGLWRAEADPSVAAILLTGRGDRGLCAGGDIRKIHESSLKQDGEAETFFKEEYALNAYIARFPKPYIALMDGITMGGGIGLAAHGSHRIVTERSKIAMPETKIGFIPDVGATWLLSRAPGEIGTYLALLGATVDAGNALYAGLADFMIPSNTLSSVFDALHQLRPGDDGRRASEILKPFSEQAKSSLSDGRVEIDRIMEAPTVQAILARAKALDTELGRQITATLAERSPTGLVNTLDLLRHARQSRTLEECLTHEYRAATRLIYQNDFREGVRAALIDKDQNPQWRPTSLEDAMRNLYASRPSEASHEKLWD